MKREFKKPDLSKPWCPLFGSLPEKGLSNNIDRCRDIISRARAFYDDITLYSPFDEEWPDSKLIASETDCPEWQVVAARATACWNYGHIIQYTLINVTQGKVTHYNDFDALLNPLDDDLKYPPLNWTGRDRIVSIANDSMGMPDHEVPSELILAALAIGAMISTLRDIQNGDVNDRHESVINTINEGNVLLAEANKIVEDNLTKRREAIEQELRTHIRQNERHTARGRKVIRAASEGGKAKSWEKDIEWEIAKKALQAAKKQYSKYSINALVDRAWEESLRDSNEFTKSKSSLKRRAYQLLNK